MILELCSNSLRHRWIFGAAMDQYSAEQHMIAQQVKANGAAVAQLTMRRFDHKVHYENGDAVSMLFDDTKTFHNVFAKEKGTTKPESSKAKKPPPKIDKRDSLPHQAMPKCISPPLMVPTHASGRINATISLSYISYLKESGSQQPHYTLKAMLLNGGKLTNKIILLALGQHFVLKWRKSLGLMILELP